MPTEQQCSMYILYTHTVGLQNVCVCVCVRGCAQYVHWVLLLSWIWFPLTQTAHHPWTTFPIMHCTHTFPSTITPITQLSPFTHQLWLPHHTCTSFSHSHKSSTQTLTQCEVLFPLANILSVILPAISVFDPGLPELGTLNLCLWPRPPAWYCFTSLALPLIFLFLPADHCPFVSASAQ